MTADARTRQVRDEPDIYVVGDAGDFPVKQAFSLCFKQTRLPSTRRSGYSVRSNCGFDPVSMCIIEQFDKATFAQVPLRLTGYPEAPVAVREDALGLYKVGSGAIWRIAKKMLGAAIPQRFMTATPFTRARAGP